VSREISQRELRDDSGEIMRQLDDGESFVITRRGVPVGELVPLRRHRYVGAEIAVAVFRSAPPIDGRRFRHDLDALADPGAEPRA
jgi:prevent-host-death family protein